ncbi:MAG: hypothetical protein NTU64_00875, partial [Hyphomicrobiales bacterium]|nr:hypothetical protein [Hyphomicrobiales bacterium]
LRQRRDGGQDSEDGQHQQRIAEGSVHYSPFRKTRGQKPLNPAFQCLGMKAHSRQYLDYLGIVIP